MIFLIYKKCKREEVVDTALEMEKDQNVEEAEVRIPKVIICSEISFQSMIEETTQV